MTVTIKDIQAQLTKILHRDLPITMSERQALKFAIDALSVLVKLDVGVELVAQQLKQGLSDER